MAEGKPEIRAYREAHRLTAAARADELIEALQFSRAHSDLGRGSIRGNVRSAAD